MNKFELKICAWFITISQSDHCQEDMEIDVHQK